MYHLWYLYMLIGVLFILPILGLIYQEINRNRNFGYYLFTLWFIINILGNHFDGKIFSLIYQDNFLNYSGYFLLGRVLYDNI
ncbi:hypothetical protein A1D22_06395 [Pasteurellaceae bacterium LFhippo2]|nr:hypothetical protein [Pasteurellaceae bacterium LFhippo2]